MYRRHGSLTSEWNFDIITAEANPMACELADEQEPNTVDIETFDTISSLMFCGFFDAMGTRFHMSFGVKQRLK